MFTGCCTWQGQPHGEAIMTEGGTSPLGYNSHFQGPVSPYHGSRYSGGSSSGSAVAVACGLVPIAVGYDGKQLRLSPF